MGRYRHIRIKAPRRKPVVPWRKKTSGDDFAIAVLLVLLIIHYMSK